MALITITIKDDEIGGCSLGISSDTDIPENDDDCTPAMVTGAMIMRLMDQMRIQAGLEGEGE